MGILTKEKIESMVSEQFEFELSFTSREYVTEYILDTIIPGVLKSVLVGNKAFIGDQHIKQKAKELYGIDL